MHGSDQKAKRQQPVTHPLTSTIDTIQHRFVAVAGQSIVSDRKRMQYKHMDILIFIY